MIGNDAYIHLRTKNRGHTPFSPTTLQKTLHLDCISWNDTLPIHGIRIKGECLVRLLYLIRVKIGRIWPDGEVANTVVCKTAIRECNSRSGLNGQAVAVNSRTLYWLCHIVVDLGSHGRRNWLVAKFTFPASKSPVKLAPLDVVFGCFDYGFVVKIQVQN